MYVHIHFYYSDETADDLNAREGGGGLVLKGY